MTQSQSSLPGRAQFGVELPLVATAQVDVLDDSDGCLVRRTVLPNGVRVLSESIPGQRSVTVGCWIPVGSRDETEGHFGSTHFLEHLLFKGTATRSVRDIANIFDAIGGESNAATAKEHTCYYAKVLDSDAEIALDVLLDMVTSARLDAQDVDSERGVILEELAMNDDDPHDVVHEKFAEQVLPGLDVGRPIGGTAETITGTTHAGILEHYQQFYVAPSLVVTAAGNLDHDWLCRRVVSVLAEHGWGDAALPPTPRRSTKALRVADPLPQHIISRPLEQANVIVGSTGIAADDECRHTLLVLNTILGGGMSSRLFQEIREKRGLAYSVYSFASAHADAGIFGLYAGCTPQRVDEVVVLLRECLADMAAAGPSQAELDRAKGHISGATVLSMEDTSARMSRLGTSELALGRYQTLAETLAVVRAVTGSQVQQLAADLASRPAALTVVGPFDPSREFAAC